jgi:NADH dehydrogenase
MTTIVVFGGSGFLGRRLVQHLVSQGATVHIAVRHPEQARDVLRQFSLERIRVFHADVRDQASVNAVLAGADAVVNAVSAYVETDDATFHAVHVQGAQTVAREAAAASVARLLLVSGLGANPQSHSPYIRARGRGELLVQQVFQGATIVRPGAMFGPGDALFSKFAALSRVLPVLPLIGGGKTRLQPVYVGDVAEAIGHVLDLPETAGQIYELAGPQVYTLDELIKMTLRLIGRRRLLVPIPIAFAEILARSFELLPNPPLTTSQVDLLKADNVLSGKMPGFRELNIEPKSVEQILPTYVGLKETGPD